MLSTQAKIVQHARTFAVQTTTDAECLARYVHDDDGEAFAELVRRHGPMVFGVCRRALGNHADADDAFQAVFIVLARDASKIREGNVAAWLHTVARRTSLRARLRRKATASLPSDIAATTADAERSVAWQEMSQALDDELSRLSADERSALVLCFLEEQTQEEAARRLGCSLSTVKRRLQQGRDSLRQRLERRGFLPAFLLASLGTAGASHSFAVEPEGKQMADALANLANPASATPAVRTLAEAPPAGLLLRAALIASALVMASTLAFVMASTGDPPAKNIASQVDEKATPVIRPLAAGRKDAFGDPLPDDVIHRFGSIRFREPNHPSNSAVDAQAKIMALGSWMGVTLFNLETGERIRELHNRDMINSFGALPRLALSPDGKVVANLMDHFSILVRDTKTGEKLWQLHTGRAIDTGLRRKSDVPSERWWAGLRFSEDGTTLFAHEHPMTNKLVAFDAVTGKELRAMATDLEILAWSQDAKRVVLVDDRKDGNALFVRKQENEARITLEFPAGVKGARAMIPCFSKDASLVAGWSGKDGVFVWNADDGKLLARLPVPKEDVPVNDPGYNALAFSNDGDTLFIGGVRWIHRWKWRKNETLSPLKGHLSWSIYRLFVTPDGRRLISNGQDGTIRRWDLEKGTEIPMPAGYSWYAGIAMGGDGRTIAMWDGDERIDVWNADTGTLRHSLPAKSLDVEGGDLSPDGKIMAGCLTDGSVVLWDTATAKKLQHLKPDKITSNGGAGRRPFVSPEGLRVFAIDNDRIGRLWDVDSAKQLWELGAGSVLAAAFSPDGKRIATAVVADHVVLRDVHNGSEISNLMADGPRKGQGSEFDARGLAFVDGGESLISWNGRAEFFTFRTSDGAFFSKKRAPCNIWRETSVSASGRWLVAMDDKYTLNVWERASWKVAYSRPLGKIVIGTRFAPDARAVALSSRTDGELRSLRPEAWNDATDAELWAGLSNADDAKLAYRAIWTLVDQPKRAQALFAEKIGGPRKVDADLTKRWIVDLDSGDFKVRDAAERGLEKLGRLVFNELDVALANAKSLEMRKRLQRLRDAIGVEHSGLELAEGRAVDVLDRIGDARSLEMLHQWSTGAPGSVLTREARSTFRRK